MFITRFLSGLFSKVRSGVGALFFWLPFRRRVARKRLKQLQQQEAKQSPNYNAPIYTIQKPRKINRFTTAVVTTGLLVAIGFLSGQAGGLRIETPLAVAEVEEEISEPAPNPTSLPLPTEMPQMTPTKEPTPSPTNTPLPEPTSTPPPAPTAVPDGEAAVVADAPPVYDPLRFGGVAFTKRENGNSDLYALTIGVDDPIRLTKHPADDREPAWSPDGRYLAFSSRRGGNWDVYVIDLLTGDLSRLTDNPAYDGAPAWSPDGQWLVYESYQDDNLDLFLVESSGEGAPVRLTEHASQDFSPTWSPRGRHIAFTSWRSGNKDIYIMSLNSLTDEGAVNVTQSPDAFEDDPAFSPDGGYIAYSDESDGYEVVYIKELDNYLPAGPAQSVGQGQHPSWSPDGSSLVYVHQNYDQYYLIASSLDAWNTAPQVFVSKVYLGDSSWSQVALPSDLKERFAGLGSGAYVPLFVEHESRKDDGGPPYLLYEIDVEAPAPYLSDRVNESFDALRERIVAEAGWDFLGRVDNMYDALDASLRLGEPAESWNKAGRAFDFYYRYPISLDPQVEIVREDRGNDTYWRVYLRTALQDGSQGEPLRQRPWDFQARYGEDPSYYDQGGKWKERPPEGYYLDFTALAEDYGWERVPASSNWRNYFQGIRYWHFVNRQDLTYNDALLEMYTINELSLAGQNP